MKVVLAAINAKYIHSNLAVYSLKAYAREWQEAIEIAEYTINQQIDYILAELYQKQPDILAFSCYIWNISYVVELVEELHKVLPRTKIWLGGPEVSFDAPALLERYPQLAGIMVGEGEAGFKEILSYYSGERPDMDSIPGIVYYDHKDMTVKVNPSKLCIDLNSIPFPYEDITAFKNRIIYYESSRGCPFSCSYCLSSVDKQLRFRDTGLVKKELQVFIDHKVPQVKFVDRTFNCKHSHAIEIWNYIIDHDNGITNFHFEISADLLNEEELALMSRMRAGLIQLEIGVQSTNETVVREIDRTMDFKKVAAIVRRINSFENIHQHLDLIAGLPYEDYQSFQKSFNDVYGLEPEQLQLGFLKVLKGSKMHQNAEMYGIAYKNNPQYEVLFTKWLTYDKILHLKGIEEMVEVYYNSRQFTNTIKFLVQAFQTPFEMFEALKLHYDEHNYTGISHSRIARYEILLEVILKCDASREAFYRELLVYDLYLRENLKNRPVFAIEKEQYKEEIRVFYQNEVQDSRYLDNYNGYNYRQLHKMTHIEVFYYNVQGDGSKGVFPILFDYKRRNPLTYEALPIAVDLFSETVQKR